MRQLHSLFRARPDPFLVLVAVVGFGFLFTVSVQARAATPQADGAVSAPAGTDTRTAARPSRRVVEACARSGSACRARAATLRMLGLWAVVSR